MLVASSLAFAPQAPCTRSLHQAPSAPRCSLLSDDAAATTTRRAVLGGICAGLGAFSAPPAWAGYVYSLGSETTKVDDAEIDDDIFQTKKVQTGLKNAKKYQAAGQALKAKFDADPNMQLIPSIRAEFDFAAVRDDLNVITTVFDDTTQETTDKISRAIIYDLTELESASRLKKGDTERTPKKIANVNKWFAKLDKDFTSLLGYYKNAPAYRPPPPPPPPPPEESPAPEPAPAQ